MEQVFQGQIWILGAKGQLLCRRTRSTSGR
jgi:GUN4-like